MRDKHHFHHLAETFPINRMESMLAQRHIDPSLPDNTDQEIMGYLFPAMDLHHPKDLKRRVWNVRCNLATEPAAALHFPGGMCRGHIDQMTSTSAR